MTLAADLYLLHPLSVFILASPVVLLLFELPLVLLGTEVCSWDVLWAPCTTQLTPACPSLSASPSASICICLGVTQIRHFHCSFLRVCDDVNIFDETKWLYVVLLRWGPFVCSYCKCPVWPCSPWKWHRTAAPGTKESGKGQTAVHYQTEPGVSSCARNWAAWIEMSWHHKMLLLRTISLCRPLKLLKICSFPIFLHEHLSMSQPHHYSCACSWQIFWVKFPCRKHPFSLGFIYFSPLCTQDKPLVLCWTIKGQSFHLKVQREMTAILPASDS